eukprot:CAMPEP_0175084148 /NCGR_PEP_ID=MMETSP0052_2-20121109/27870_1 /TAXON_ID=51329 ORGANISM="Polytomella parva, Strain SAG 63-3" /NCGR_SAMPLE_ID=MMETSP0052_2 /ASSEMBLY_ACC=CAM_ASM_000194 /LENGTH=53 /DNA_ID=CAMNT_0016355863 /DNA_START=922 /DNA_END=1079 /DNA_ORIENTATION=-
MSSKVLLVGGIFGLVMLGEEERLLLFPYEGDGTGYFRIAEDAVSCKTLALVRP